MKSNNRKTNTLPDFKHTPLPPEPKKRSVEEAAKGVFDLLNHLLPDEQNKVIAEVLAKTAQCRYDDYELARNNEKAASENLERLLSFTRGIEGVVKEHANLKGQ